MEWTVLFTGPEGAGKPQAVSSVFDIATVDTEVAETARIAQLKACIAMAVDVDRVELGVAGTGKLSLLGSLTQKAQRLVATVLIRLVTGLSDHSRRLRTGQIDQIRQQMESANFSRLPGPGPGPGPSTLLYSVYLS